MREATTAPLIWARLRNGALDSGVQAASGHSPAATVYGTEDRFLVYSYTKTILACAALRLAGRGSLGLEDPLSRWIPDAPHAERIRIRHILAHTSGLPDYGGLAEYHAAVRSGEVPWTREEYFTRTQADRLLFPPGAGWAYSNLGYRLVREVVDAASGKGIDDFLREEFFAPLGLAATAWVNDDDGLAGLAFGPSAYLGGDAAPRQVAGHYAVGWVAHGVVASTVSEAARFHAALLSGQLLAPDLLHEMMALRVVAEPMAGRPFGKPGYGLGLMGDAVEPPGPFGHTGGGPGASVAVYGRPGPQPLVAAVFTPGELTGPAENLAFELVATAS